MSPLVISGLLGMNDAAISDTIVPSKSIEGTKSLTVVRSAFFGISAFSFLKIISFYILSAAITANESSA